MYVYFKIYQSAKTIAQKHTPHTFVPDIFTTTHVRTPDLRLQESQQLHHQRLGDQGAQGLGAD
jgi:hypothetical protein